MTVWGIPLEYFFMAISVIAGFIALFTRSLAFYLRLFPYFLLLTLATEITAWQLSMHNRGNAALYNFFSMVAFVFYMNLLRKVVFSRQVKKIILYITIVYTLVSLVNIFFIQKINTYHTITYSVGCFLIIMTTVYFFYEMFRFPRWINLMKEPIFWVVSGLLFFYSCSLPILGIVNYIDSFPRVIATNLEPIITIVNILLYSLFTIALLCRLNLKRSTL